MTFTVHKDVKVAMRDGTELATDLWVPETTPAPTLLVRLPYGKDLPALFAYGLVPNIFALTEAGYAVVWQDCRGTFRSGGEFTPMNASGPAPAATGSKWLARPAQAPAVSGRGCLASPCPISRWVSVNWPGVRFTDAPRP